MRPSTQRGAVTLWLVAALLSLVLFSSLALDMARLAYQRHELQSIADLAALKVSRSTPYFIGAANTTQLEASLLADYQGKIDSLELSYGTAQIVDNHWVLDMSAVPDNGYQSAQVTVKKTVPQSTIAGGVFNQAQITLVAKAAIQKTGWIRFGIGSKTISLTEAGTLNSLLSGLLGTTINIDVASYQGLLDSAINLNALIEGIAVKENLGSPAEVLDANLSLLTVLDVYLDVLNNSGQFPSALSLLINDLTMAPITIPDIKLSDIIVLSPMSNTYDAALASSINALQLVTSSIYVANHNHFVEIPNLNVSLPGITSLTLSVNIIEPAQFNIATIPILAGAEPSVSNSQVALKLQADLSLLNLLGAITSIVGISLNVSQLDLTANLSKSKATVDDFMILDDDLVAQFTTQSSLLDVEVAPLSIKLTLFGLPLADVTAHISVESKDPVTNILDVSLASLPYQTNMPHDDLLTTSITLSVNSGTLSSVLSSALSSVLNGIISPLLSLVLLPVIEALGVEVGGANLWVDAINTNQSGLIL